MSRLVAFLVAVSALLIVVAPVFAQQPGGAGSQPMPPSASGSPGMGGPMGGMGQAPMMGGMGMCPMMGMMSGGMTGGGMPQGMMGGGGMMPMMGMMGQGNPKTMAQMLQMRGEMLKAVGDVMIKYGKTMESTR
jgi:hypothetical protein